MSVSNLERSLCKNVMSRHDFEWHKRFQKGRKKVEDILRLERLSSTNTD